MSGTKSGTPSVTTVEVSDGVAVSELLTSCCRGESSTAGKERLTICSLMESRTETMIAASRLSRKRTKKIGTEKRLPMIAN